MVDANGSVGGAKPGDTNGSAANSSASPSNKAGWDGKLRVNKQATLVNPEALEDPDYSDEDAPPVDQIGADDDLLDGEDSDTEAWLPYQSRIEL